MTSPEEPTPEENKNNLPENASEMPMSPEDFQEMMDQIPTLREMLEERKKELGELGEDTAENTQRKLELKTEIEELAAEIEAREELDSE